jgi:hypothetical protein
MKCRQQKSACRSMARIIANSHGSFLVERVRAGMFQEQ